MRKICAMKQEHEKDMCNETRTWERYVQLNKNMGKIICAMKQEHEKDMCNETRTRERYLQ